MSVTKFTIPVLSFVLSFEDGINSTVRSFYTVFVRLIHIVCFKNVYLFIQHIFTYYYLRVSLFFFYPSLDPGHVRPQKSDLLFGSLYYMTLQYISHVYIIHDFHLFLVYYNHPSYRIRLCHCVPLKDSTLVQTDQSLSFFWTNVTTLPFGDLRQLFYLLYKTGHIIVLMRQENHFCLTSFSLSFRLSCQLRWRYQVCSRSSFTTELTPSTIFLQSNVDTKILTGFSLTITSLHLNSLSLHSNFYRRYKNQNHWHFDLNDR